MGASPPKTFFEKPALQPGVFATRRQKPATREEPQSKGPVKVCLFSSAPGKPAGNESEGSQAPSSSNPKAPPRDFPKHPRPPVEGQRFQAARTESPPTGHCRQNTGIHPAQGVFAVGGPDAVLLLMIDHHLVDTGVLLLISRHAQEDRRGAV